jgi:hypothetical protein
LAFENLRVATIVPSEATQSYSENSLNSGVKRTKQGFDLVYTARFGARHTSTSTALEIGFTQLKSPI